MRDADWRGLDEQALERMLIERWLYRGMMLGVIMLSAITATYLGVRGLTGLVDQVTVGALLALALAAGAVAFTMRLQDLRIQAELRRRKFTRPGPPS